MTAPELSRPVRIDTLGAAPQTVSVEAGEGERAALARRFGLVAITTLGAEMTLIRKGEEIHTAGTLTGAVTQCCVASGAAIEAKVEASFDLMFRPQPASGGGDEEIEIEAGELDTIFYEGGLIDVGEAVAETLLLNLDPYPRAAGAEETLKAAGVQGEEETGPFAALAGLRDKLKN